jgi:hypothetical protein
MERGEAKPGEAKRGEVGRGGRFVLVLPGLLRAIPCDAAVGAGVLCNAAVFASELKAKEAVFASEPKAKEAAAP